MLLALAYLLLTSDARATSQCDPGAAEGSCAAPPEPDVVVPARRSDSINVSPLGLLYGSYSLNFEHLGPGSHGFMIEGSTARYSGTSSTVDGASGSARASNYGGGVGYRWHWSGRESSGFLGVMAGYTVGTGSSRVTINGTSQSYDLRISAPWIVGNIGKRWQWDSGVNVTFRVGAGLARYTVRTSSPSAEAQDAAAFLQDVLTYFPVAIDGELSVGYTF